MGKGGTEINYPEQASYSEGMKESLQAQLDLAEDLYRSEASQQYGRPAYAQLESDILRETLLGAERLEDRPATARDIQTEEDQYLAYLEQAAGPNYFENLPDEERAAYGDDKLTFAKQMYENLGRPKGIDLPTVGETYDTATGTTYDPQTIKGKGLIDLMGGQGVQEFAGGIIESPTQPGTGILGSETRRAGFDPTTGDFMGLSEYGSDIAEQAARRQRSADIKDVQQFGPLATQAIRDADPLASGLLSQMGQQANTALGQIQRMATAQDVADGLAEVEGEMISDQYGGLLGQMQTSAATDLEAGRGLTPRQRREAEQSARAGWEARGLVRDPGAVVGEVESVMEARGIEEAKRRAFAQNVLGLEAMRRGEGRTLAQATMGASQAMTADPFMAILGRPSGASQQIAQQGLGAAGYGLTAPQNMLFDPSAGLGYMMSQQTNQANIASAQAQANAMKQAGMIGGLAGMTGTLGAAGIKQLCWVAREVYGERNPKWLLFRQWLFSKAPSWFQVWYLINGPTVADWLADKPRAKARVRAFMDSKLGELNNG